MTAIRAPSRAGDTWVPTFAGEQEGAVTNLNVLNFTSGHQP